MIAVAPVEKRPPDCVFRRANRQVPAASVPPPNALGARLRHINAAARLHRARDGDVPLSAVLDVGGFNRGRALELAPSFLEPETPSSGAAPTNCPPPNARSSDRRVDVPAQGLEMPFTLFHLNDET